MTTMIAIIYFIAEIASEKLITLEIDYWTESDMTKELFFNAYYGIL